MQSNSSSPTGRRRAPYGEEPPPHVVRVAREAGYQFKLVRGWLTGPREEYIEENLRRGDYAVVHGYSYAQSVDIYWFWDAADAVQFKLRFG